MTIDQLNAAIEALRVKLRQLGTERERIIGQIDAFNQSLDFFEEMLDEAEKNSPT